MEPKILIVENETVVALEIEDILKRAGYSFTMVVNTGREAILCSQEIVPDLILINIGIKGEIDGIETANRIRSKQEIPVIFLSSDIDSRCPSGMKTVQPFGCVQKPDWERDLDFRVEMALYAAQLESERRQEIEAWEQVQKSLEKKVNERIVDLERAKERAEQANREKSDCLANVSHELRSPLHNILSFARIGGKKTGSVPEQKIIEFFNNIEESSKTLLTLVDDILDLARLESGKMVYQMSEISFDTMVENIVSEYHTALQKKGIQVNYSGFHQDIKLVCDPNRMGQVIRNLISNATKFSPRESRITIALDPNHQININGACDPREMPAFRLTIMDEGDGIPEEELEVVFDKFVQGTGTNCINGGTGLGLTICREIVLHHKGRIWAEKNPVRGSSFNILLPCQQVTAPESNSIIHETL